MDLPDLVPTSRIQLSHERLKAFTVAEQLDEAVVRICRRAPRGNAPLLDQAQRASSSVVLNLVEANGRVGQDRVQHLRIAKGSALEADAAVGLLERRRLVSQQERAEVRAIVYELVRMLSGLMKVAGKA